MCGLVERGGGSVYRVRAFALHVLQTLRPLTFLDANRKRDPKTGPRFGQNIVKGNVYFFRRFFCAPGGRRGGLNRLQGFLRPRRKRAQRQNQRNQRRAANQPDTRGAKRKMRGSHKHLLEPSGAPGIEKQGELGIKTGQLEK